MTILNKNNETPNVLHFHGQNAVQLKKTFKTIFDMHEVSNEYDIDRLDIISCWTDDEKCCLNNQCKKYGIKIINSVPDTYDRTQKWYMPNKIKFYIDALKESKKEFVLLLDGYDVLLTHLDDIIDRFTSQKYRILFGPSCNNYPDVHVDKLYNRHNMGTYRYFNAGCAIGYREDLINFYEESLKYINMPNPVNSEQLVMRYAFKKYSLDKEQDYVGVDYNCHIFQSMGLIISHINNDNTGIYFTLNGEPPCKNVIVVGSEKSYGEFMTVANMLKSSTRFNVFEFGPGFNERYEGVPSMLYNKDVDAVIITDKDVDINYFNDIAKSCSIYNTKLIYKISGDNVSTIEGASDAYKIAYAGKYCENNAPYVDYSYFRTAFNN